MYNKSKRSFYSTCNQCDYNVRSEHIVLSTVALCERINSNYVAMFMDCICTAFVVCVFFPLALLLNSCGIFFFPFLDYMELKGGTKDMTESISINSPGHKYQMYSVLCIFCIFI